MRKRGRRRHRGLWVAGWAATLLAWGGCREGEPDPEIPEEVTGSALELGRIGGRIYNEPDRTLEILEQAGMSPEDFEARVRRVTLDPQEGRDYARGFELVARPVLPRPEPPPDGPDSVLHPDTGGAAAPDG